MNGHFYCQIAYLDIYQIKGYTRRNRAIAQETKLFNIFKKKSTPPMHPIPTTLEEQLAELTRLGLCLNEGITIDDLLYSFPREQYEKRPFELILFMLGVEVERAPWGRPICSSVWNFDLECICQSGDYLKIVNRLCAVAGKRNHLTEIEDFVDIQKRQAWLKYALNGVSKQLTIKVHNDWADVNVIMKVMSDIETDGHRFYFKDNGQAMVMYYLDDATACELNRLSGGALSPLVL